LLELRGLTLQRLEDMDSSMRCQSLSFVSVSSSTNVRLSSRPSLNAKIISVRKTRRPKILSTQLRKSKMLEMLEKHRTMQEGNKSF